MEPVLINGRWRPSDSAGSFRAANPNRGEPMPEEYPVSSPDEIGEALQAGTEAARSLARGRDPEATARFLEAYADRLDADRERLTEVAFEETGLPVEPRLAGELARTTDQLRQAAAAARDRTWTTATIDVAAGIRSMYGPLGKPVIVFGPNNFPMAFNGVAGGDFAAAIAAGNPVIAKANTGHPRTTQLMAESARAAAEETGAPPALVQLIYRTSHRDGEAMVADPRAGAIGFTGSKKGGLALKEAADGAGVPIYLELGSVNPVFLLDGALRSRGEEIARDFYGSGTLGAGQFCTNPGLVFVPDTPAGDRFAERAAELFASGEAQTLLSEPGHLTAGASALRERGAEELAGGGAVAGNRFAFRNTLLTVSGERFAADPQGLQTEVFGPVSLLVRVADAAEMAKAAETLDGALTGSVYSDRSGAEEEDYRRVAGALRGKVGRLLNDKMPTGVAVVSSMNHGGPYPATGHPGFTAVGLPASIHRFAALHCYDNVPGPRLPEELRDRNPNGRMFRLIDGRWTQDDVPAAEE